MSSEYVRMSDTTTKSYIFLVFACKIIIKRQKKFSREFTKKKVFAFILCLFVYWYNEYMK